MHEKEKVYQTQWHSEYRRVETSASSDTDHRHVTAAIRQWRPTPSQCVWHMCEM